MLFRKKYNPEEQLMKIFNEHQGKIIIDGWNCLYGIANNGGYIIPGIKQEKWKALSLQGKEEVRPSCGLNSPV